jgi:hypothetical protein
MPNRTFVVGALEGNHVAITIFGYENPQAVDAADANWLSAEIAVSAGGWSGRVRNAYFSTAEIAEFRDQVDRLAGGRQSEANLEPMEPHLILKLASEASGKLQVSGVAFDQPDGVNALAFNWLADFRQLKALSKQLADIEKAYPPR